MNQSIFSPSMILALRYAETELRMTNWERLAVRPRKAGGCRWCLVCTLHPAFGLGAESSSLCLWVVAGLITKPIVILCSEGMLKGIPDTAKTGTCRSSGGLTWAQGDRQGTGEGHSSASGLFLLGAEQNRQGSGDSPSTPG